MSSLSLLLYADNLYHHVANRILDWKREIYDSGKFAPFALIPYAPATPSGPHGISLEAGRGCVEIGANVAITYVTREDGAKNAEALTLEYGVKTQAYHCDIRSYADAEALIQSVIRDFSHIDGFIAGKAAKAGVLGGGVEDWMDIK
jgi:hypothetical protein